MSDDDAAEDEVPDDDVPELESGETYTSGGLQSIANSSFESGVFRIEGSCIKAAQIGNELSFRKLSLVLTI